MEAFTLLKYWRGSGAGGGTGDGGGVCNLRTTATHRKTAVETEEDEDDDGPFFDLEFALPPPYRDENEGSESEGDEEDNGSTGTDGERDFNFTVSSGSTGSGTDSSFSFSPSDDLFFRGRFVSLEPSSSLGYDSSSEPVSKVQFGLSLLKTATKFRVSILGSKKARSTTEISNGDSPKVQSQQQHPSKLFAVKFRFEDVPSNPVISFFSRDYSSRTRSSGIRTSRVSSDEVGSDEKKFLKDVLQKYLKVIKPLYVRGSKRHVEKLRSSEHLNNRNAASTENLPEGMRVACKNLVKSRSASSNVLPMTPQASRRDDSLMQQQDGIQGAILHCKRSFTASRDSCTKESTEFVDSTRCSFEGGNQACI